jgi:glycosyltransferase involved in cell wall biosynthesis
LRIVVATFGTIPGFSGGWTTPLDLLQPEHEASYVSFQGPPGRYVLEGVPVRSPSVLLRFTKPWPALNRFRFMLRDMEMRRLIRAAIGEHRADFVLCLDEVAGWICRKAGFPYAMRFHSQPRVIPMERVRQLMDSALFSTQCPGVTIPGCEVLPHNVDLTRFPWADHPRAETALLVSSLDWVHVPEMFIQGVAMSRLRGVIAGDGPLRSEVERMCASTGGKVSYRPPVPRLALPAFYSGFQVGVATCVEFPWVYQMKVNEYLAAGLYALVMPWTHLAMEAPALTSTFTTAEELASRLDWLAEDWGSTLETRKAGRAWMLEHYSMEEPRERFREILKQTFGRA